MHLRRIWILLLSLLAACSVYESSGRKSFESNAPDQVQRSSVATVAEDFSPMTCWNQPKQDPLWHFDTHAPLTVTEISPDVIQVCFEDAP